MRTFLQNVRATKTAIEAELFAEIDNGEGKVPTAVLTPFSMPVTATKDEVWSITVAAMEAHYRKLGADRDPEWWATISPLARGYGGTVVDKAKQATVDGGK